MSINWLAHFQLRGSAADSHLVDDSSLLNEPDSKDDSWLKGMAYLSIIIIYNSRTL